MSVRYIRLEGNVENEIECNKTITTSFSTIYYPVITTVIIVYLFFFFFIIICCRPMRANFYVLLGLRKPVCCFVRASCISVNKN